MSSDMQYQIFVPANGGCVPGALFHRVDGNTSACRHCGYRNPPSVKWNHIDGPMMIRGDGTLKWLTWRERFMHWIGAWSLDHIEGRPSPWS